MAAVTVKSDQMAAYDDETKRLRTTEEHGKKRVQYFKYTNTSGGDLDANSYIQLCKLPQGLVRVLPRESFVKFSAMTGASMRIGADPYASTYIDDAVNPRDVDMFMPSTSVAAAGYTSFSTGATGAVKVDAYNVKGVVVAAQITGGVIPANATVEGYITYVYE